MKKKITVKYERQVTFLISIIIIVFIVNIVISSQKMSRDEVSEMIKEALVVENKGFEWFYIEIDKDGNTIYRSTEGNYFKIDVRDAIKQIIYSLDLEVDYTGKHEVEEQCTITKKEKG